MQKIADGVRASVLDQSGDTMYTKVNNLINRRKQEITKDIEELEKQLTDNTAIVNKIAIKKEALKVLDSVGVI